MKRYNYILLFLMTFVVAQAQKLSVNVPQHVVVGEPFLIEYTVNTQNVHGFQHGNMPDGVQILDGPNTSSQSSFQVINGHTSSSSSVSIAYIARITKKGTFTIPSAQVNVGGKTVSSSAARITAIGASHASSDAVSSYDDNDNSTYHHSISTPRTGEEIFIRVTANKKKVHEQEPVLLTYKVYTLVDLAHLEGKVPDLKGFHTQEIKLPAQKTYHQETVNGHTYNCVTWSQYVMYPQMTGKLEIPSITFHGIIRQEAHDPLSFITGGGYHEVKRDIKAAGVTIQVDPLPEKPTDFSGGVGHFSISSQLNHSEVKAGDPINLRVVVSGVGNLKLIQQPEVSFPEGWEKYDAKVTDKTLLTANGVEGSIVYDILAVPRKEGNYTLPPVKFTYYDTAAGSYKTIQTQSFPVKVLKGDGTVSTVSDYTSVADEDIHPIKTGKTKPHARNDFFYASGTYWFIIALLFALLVAVLFMFRKTALDRADIVKMKGKNANKVAQKRLKKAADLMQRNQPEAFYDEVLRALWGYVGDKLNIPVEQLSRENISEQLAQRHVDEATISKFISALDECEFERYAPGDAKGNMTKTFDAAVTAITRIEDAVNAKRTGKTTSMLLIAICLAALFPLSSSAITKDNADTEYKKGNYQQAIKDYEELLKNGVSAELYYNLGNSYYRTDNITKAVLAYERALLLSPGDDDIRFNLQMARAKTIDKITPRSEMFFVTWSKALVSIMSVDAWAYTAVISLGLLIFLLLLYLMADRILYRKIGFYGAVACFLLFVFSNVFAQIQCAQLKNRTGAIVTATSAQMKKSPDKSSADVIMLHEGTRVDILDKSISDWYSVQLADGKEGWIEVTKVEEI